MSVGAQILDQQKLMSVCKGSEDGTKTTGYASVIQFKKHNGRQVGGFSAAMVNGTAHEKMKGQAGMRLVYSLIPNSPKRLCS